MDADVPENVESANIVGDPPAGFQFAGPIDGPAASAITTFHHPARDAAGLFRALEQRNVVASLRFDRGGRQYIRLSPHFYNTLDEMARVVEILIEALGD